MLGPFYDRTGAKIAPERWQALVSEEGYSDIATSKFPALGVTVRSRWLGHDREDNSPPKIFITKAMGGRGVPEIASASEEEALAIHESTCQRYREQSALLADGGAGLLTEGVL